MTKRFWILALGGSLGVHLGAAALTIKTTPDIEITGSGALQSAVLGTAEFNTIMAGTTAGGALPQNRVAPTRAETRSQELRPMTSHRSVQPVTQPVNAPARVPAMPIGEGQMRIAASDNGQSSSLSPVGTADTVEALRESRETLQPAPINSEQDDLGKQDRIADAETGAPVPMTKPARPERTASASQIAARQPSRQPFNRVEANRPGERSSGSSGRSSQTVQVGGARRQGNDANPGNADVTNYPALVQRKLNRSVRAPRGGLRAVRDVTVSFTISATGTVSALAIVQSSGSSQHDKAALDAVRRGSPYPQIPAAAGRSSWSFTLPIRFSR